jgi:hypothetical protein
VRAIILSLFLFACTGDYIDTFWSKDEQVNSCLPSVKYYWGLRGETVYLDDSGAEIIVVEEHAKASACIIKDANTIEIESWILAESDRFCDVIAHEVGHGLGYQHSSSGLMAEYFPLDSSPIILPVSSAHRGDE